MEMLLMGACLSMFGLAVTALAFGAATRTEESSPAVQPRPEVVKAMADTRFFVSKPAIPASRPRIPIEALLLQIENHVRLEQAAAESFLEAPNAALLQSRTTSPLVN